MRYIYSTEEASELNSRGWRVKLYKLNHDGTWDDCGTGRIAVFQTSHNEQNQQEKVDIVAYYLCMHMETDDDLSVASDLLLQGGGQQSDSHHLVLLRVPILHREVYQRQGDNIITWSEPQFQAVGERNRADLALSFQDNAGCADIWHQIQNCCAVDTAGGVATPPPDHCQNNNPDALNKASEMDEDNADVYNSFTHAYSTNGGLVETEGGAVDNTVAVGLNTTTHAALTVEPTIEALDHIANLIPIIQATMIIRNKFSYLYALLNLFPTLEEDGDFGNLANLACIIKAILLLNEPAIIELICEGGLIASPVVAPQDEVISVGNETETVTTSVSDGTLSYAAQSISNVQHHGLDSTNNTVATSNQKLNGLDESDIFVRVCGVMEYDPDLRVKAYHRKYFKRASFKTVIQITDNELLFNIHKSYRANYILNNLLDGGDVSALNSLLYFHYGDVVRSVTSSSGTDNQKDECYMIKVLRKLEECLQHLETMKAVRNHQHDEQENNDKLLNNSAADDNSCVSRSGCGAGGHHSDENSISVATTTTKKFGPFVQVVATEDMTLESLKERRSIALGFLRELFHIVRNSLQPQHREDFMDILLNEAEDVKHQPNILAVLSTLIYPEYDAHSKKLGHNSTFSNEMVVKALDILIAISYSRATTVRNYCAQFVRQSDVDSIEDTNESSSLKAKSSKSLLYSLMLSLVTTNDTAVLLSVVECLRTLLDTPCDNEVKFVNQWYEFYLPHFLSPFKSNDLYDGYTAASLMYIIDLISFCVRTHTHACKNFILQSRILGYLLKVALGDGVDRCTKLSALRLLRSIVGIKDQIYERHIVQNNLFAPVFDCFMKNPIGDNLVSSSIVELCDFIRSENITILLTHIVQKHLDTAHLEQMAFPYVGTFSLLRDKYEENLAQEKLQEQQALEHGLANSRSIVDKGGTKRLLSQRAIEDQRRFQQINEEDSYFSTDDEVVPNPAGHNLHTDTIDALMQYGSDEEDRDEKRVKF